MDCAGTSASEQYPIIQRPDPEHSTPQVPPSHESSSTVIHMPPIQDSALLLMPVMYPAMG